MKKVRNKYRKFGSANFYYQLKNEGRYYLFTEKEIENAKMRAMCNPEDIDKSKKWNIFLMIKIIIAFCLGFLLNQIF